MLEEDKLQKICDRLEIKIEDLIESYQAEVDADIVIGIIKIQIARRDFTAAFKLIDQLERSQNLDEGKRHEVVLYKSDCLLQTRKADHALKLLTELSQALEERNDQNPWMMATLYDLLGKAYPMSSEPNLVKGYASSLRAFQICTKHLLIDELTARIAYNLGKTCNALRNAIDAKEYFNIAQEYFEKVSDPKELALTLFEQGITYSQLKNFKKAQSCLDHSLAIYNSLNMQHMAQRVKRTIADLVLSRTDPQLAIRMQIECAQMFEQLEDFPRLAYTYGTIASLHLELRNLAEARSYLEMAMKLIPVESSRNPRYAFIYRVQAQYLCMAEKFVESIEFSSKSTDLFDKMGMEREAADSLEISVQAYRQLGDLEKVIETYERVTRLLRGSLSLPPFKQRGYDQ